MIEVLLAGLSAASRRQYEHTFIDWRIWCAETSTPVDAISTPNVLSYLRSRPLSRATCQARLTHLRRLVHTLFDACKLKWTEIDFEQEYIIVMGGKGRQRSEGQYVPFLGSIARHLLAWKPHVADRVYVFPRILKGDHLGKDVPITPDGLYKQFEADFAPHDAHSSAI